ncbi:unnamed protein product [Phytomonas sp. Hart1]|nr:unnamed protein product [Phytomonas sp. Hart1]|eukprot:CCW66791.1 unnamed protein product [Phytomonas sp. isolate Hart1]
MVRGLRYRPYFTHSLPAYVNLPGRDPDEALFPWGKPKAAAPSSGAEAEAPNEKKPGGNAPDSAEKARWVRQFPAHQRDLVSAVAVVSAGWQLRALRQQLRDLPGFLSAWRLHARHFRVVFRDLPTLLKAKQLLDQFHLEGNVRVELRLSDAHSRAFAAFVAEQETASGQE